MKFEQLQPRLCFASLWQNPDLRFDVDRSGDVVVADTICILDRLNEAAPLELASVRDDGSMFYDTNGDMLVTPLDALLVINALDFYRDPLEVNGQLSGQSDPNQNGVVLQDRVQIFGQTLGGVRIDFRMRPIDGGANAEPVASTISASDGSFELEVDLENGRQDFDLIATDPLGRTESIRQTIRRSDLIEDWNAVTLDVIRHTNTPPPLASRNLAMIHLAMFDAANAIEMRFKSYLDHVSYGEVPASNASKQVAAAVAAHHVALALFDSPDEIDAWNSTLSESLSLVDDSPAKDAGIQLGQAIGTAVLRERADDGSQATSEYSVGDQPGDWNPTEPDFADPLLPQWRYVEPFAIDSPQSYRPEPPPSLTSLEYAASVDQVMRYGGTESLIRTDEQEEIAIFWADASGTFMPPGHWNQIAADVTSTQELSIVEKARVFALLNVALADAGIASWDAKYEYDLWRPSDAIRQANIDGNEATSADPDWTPMIVNPPFPAYTSGHSSFSGAADAVLTHLLGDSVAFTSDSEVNSSDGQPIQRSFDSFTEAADEAGMSRIYGGIHFDFDNTAGLQAGRAIGSDVVHRLLRPN